MKIDPMQSIKTRFLAIGAIAFWIPVVASFAFSPGARWAEYPGLFFHLNLFLLVYRLDAPDWAKSAGYGWLILDVVVGILSINGAPQVVTANIRFGAHIFGGIWLAVSSLPGSSLLRIVGVTAGTWLAAFSFVSPLVAPAFLGPVSVLVLTWLAIIAIQNGVSAKEEAPITVSHSKSGASSDAAINR